ncbi:MAG: VWA domain-containing protein, partial [Lachnospiraceae bacterium]|nr:VWA domain-containing protein [Lachnospiraceae bacterium]
QYPGRGSGGQPQKNRGRSIGLLIGLIIAAAAVFFIILVQLGTIKVKNPLSSKNERTAVATETLSGAAGAEPSPADTAETTGQAESVSTAETAAEAQAEPAQDQNANAPAAQDGGRTANAPAAQNGGQTGNAPAGDQTANAPAAAPAASPLSISVQQVDASAYPEVKLYLDVVNENTGEIPSDLEQMVFYIGREDATATYVEQTVTEVSQLNGSEALKVDMVADISGSMDGYPMTEAKSVMSSFVQSMQFNAGDEVELTSFSNGVHLNEEFTSDASAILNAIDSLYTEDMTALYDALYTSVTRVASQNGARCVIAFTDGDDNYSSCTMDDVIEVAQRYSIPVFIIGVGYVDESAMETIASSTGGVYYGIDEISSMQEIYDQIYRMEKELYLVSYTDSTGLAVEETANLTIRYESSVYVGECSYSYVPNTLINVDAGWLYQDGPEAVVEAYMKNFDDAMTNMDFSYIEPYLEYGSPIYNEQVSYVQRGISEQLDSYEFVDTTYESSTSAIVTTRETYYYQKPGEALKLMTQQCSYRVIYDGSQWQMYEFTDLDVLWRINA